MKLTYLLAAGIALATVACDKDDEPVTKADIVGTWEMTEYDATTELEAQGTLTTSTSTIGDDHDVTIEFREDDILVQSGTYQVVTEVEIDGETFEPVTQTFDAATTATYEVNDGRLTGAVLSTDVDAQVVDDPDAGYALQLDGDRLTMTTEAQVTTNSGGAAFTTNAELRMVLVRQ